MVAGTVEKNLRFIFQPAKRPRMNDAGSVALKLCPERMARLRILTSPGFARLLGVRRQNPRFVLLHLLAGFPAIAHRLIRHVRSILSLEFLCESGLAVFWLAKPHRPFIVSEP